MRQKFFHRAARPFGLTVFALALLLNGCGSGSSSGTIALSDPSDPVDPTPTPTPTPVIQNSIALGPIGGATVTVWSLAGQAYVQTVSTAFDTATDLSDDNHTLVPYAEQGVGKFSVSLPGLPLDQLVLVKSEGGEDIDPNDDGQYDAAAVQAVPGSLYAYVTVSDLQNNRVRVNAFTTLAAEWIRQEGLTDAAEIKKVLAELAKKLYTASAADNNLSNFNPAELAADGSVADLTLLADPALFPEAVASNTVQELYTGTTHLLRDTDNDGLFDDFELLIGTDPYSKNSDGDALGDYGEFIAGTDPLVADTATYEDNLTAYQWHLDSTEPNGIDVASVWESYAGRRNLHVGIVDTGVQAVHPDLVSNLDLAKSYRYSDGTNDPSPDANQLANDPYLSGHGTACAGLVAAAGWNKIGVRGVAPFVKLAGYNAFSNPTDASFANALGREVDISSNSWGDPAEVLIADQILIDSIKTGAETGRDGKGTVYVMAAGNDRSSTDYAPLHIGNANNAGVANNPYVITVSAIDTDGGYASYANFGANVLVSAPGGEFGEQYDAANGAAIVTTDYTGYTYGLESTGFVNTYRDGYFFDVPGNPNGDYTNYMNGTSAAAPMVSGIVALMLGANPALTYRDVRYILATTAKKNDPGDSDWTTNGAGYPINHNYGFGRVDAAAAVAKAETFTSLGAETVLPKRTNDVPDTAIPDADSTGVSSTITVPESLSVEHVDVWVTIGHNRPGDLDIRLVSPKGTESRLAYGGAYYLEGSYTNWRFSTVRCLDENAKGTWTLKVRDLRAAETGVFMSWSLQIRGH